MADSQCTDPNKPFCGGEDARYTCVECRDDVQCASGLCLPNGSCGQCGPDAMCPIGQTCSADGKCVIGCASAQGNCPTGTHCKAGSDICVDCTLDTHCGPGRICGPDSTCVPGCSMQNPNCPMGLVCDMAGKQCVGCVQSSDCHNPQLPACDVSSKTCVACIDNSTCPSSAPVCDVPAHACVTCLQNSDCPSGAVCDHKTCVPGCTATQPCPTGLQCDLGPGACVTCVNDSHCGSGAPRCDPASQTCVACLPGPSDNCSSGNYCRPDHVCERGCKTGSDCPSGLCLADHSCQACTLDTQCAAGKVCMGGVCTAACGPQNPCGAGKSCCNERCLDELSDPLNCGACGNVCGAGSACCQGQCKALNTGNDCGACGKACGAGSGCCGGSCAPTNVPAQCGACGVSCGADQFCDGSACVDLTFPNFCANKKVYAIYDGISIDDAATNVLASTIALNCSASTVISYGPQSNPAWVDQSTGALLLGSGATVVTAGGPFPNKPLKWLERTQQLTRVYFYTNGIDTYSFKRRSDESTLTSMTVSQCNPHHDRFVVELSTDPANGTLALIGYGVCNGGYGTQAAAYLWANVMLPNRSAYPDSWYLFDWVDTNNDSIANDGDTFTKLVSGL
jgi:Cys-rich repeat protein